MIQFLAKSMRTFAVAGCHRSFPRHLLHNRTTLALLTVVTLNAHALDATRLRAESTDRPNIVVILADDQGWGDLSVSGNANLATPHIDSLARDGATLEHFYVCQVCAPTRAEFLTGRYYPRTGVSGVSRGQERLNADETTIADRFRSAGYATGAFGKWHNGTQSPYHPNDRGFDEYYGFTSGHWGHYFSPPLDHNGATVRGNGFIVDDFTDRAIDFIQTNKDRPFLCYLPLNTPHSPMMVPDRFYEKFDGAELGMRHRDVEKEDVMMTRAALALVENIDWNVGRVLAALTELGLRDETIVVYFSDNGPNSYRWNGGLKGRKGSIDEGGLRSPCFIRWPGHIRGGLKVAPVTAAIDLLPTLTELAGVEWSPSKPIDGRSLQPLLLEQSTQWPSRMIFSVKNQQVSVRTQQFRLDADGRLFDLEVDPGQRQDVSRQHPALAAELMAAAGSMPKRCARISSNTLTVPLPLGTQSPRPCRHATASSTVRSSEAPKHRTTPSSRTGPTRAISSPGTSRLPIRQPTRRSCTTRVPKATSAPRLDFRWTEATGHPISRVGKSRKRLIRRCMTSQRNAWRTRTIS